MKSLQIGWLSALALLALGRPAAAEDIDLFVKAKPVSDAPNVLFVIDNAANFSSDAKDTTCIIDGKATALSGTVGGIEQCALYKVVKELPEDSVRIGVMVYNAANVVDHLGVECMSVAASTPGGCLVYPIKLMSAANKAEILAWIKKWKTSGKGEGYIKAASEATGGSVQEAWAYITGRTGLSGTDYARRPRPDKACSTYVIFIGNSFSSAGSPGDQTGDKGPQGALNGTNPTAGMNAFPAATAEMKVVINKTITTSCGTATLGAPHESKGYYADEWTRYMNVNGITTYTIGLLGPSCQADYSGTLTSMANVGGGKYFPTRNFDELVVAIKTALSEMLSVNSVFASVSLPISVNTEGTYLNQVYIGMFRPDRDTLPRWMGNLKQYRMGKVDGVLRLLDAKASPEPAISSAGTGFLSACALSYWTPTISDAYWALMVERNCEIADARSNTPDGPVVEKGAQGYTLRGTAVDARNLETCNDAVCSELDDFDADNGAITKARLGNWAMTDKERELLINWARGLNNRGTPAAKAVNPMEEADEAFVAAAAMRASVHGDVVHSRPVAINYAADDADVPEVVVFYGGNDGVLRAINGNRTAAIDGIAAGREMWAFMAPESFGHIKRLRDNSPMITVKGKDDGVPRRPKPYGFDGAITAYTHAEDRWIFATMRRGGRMVYAFDVSNITDDQDSPDILWRFGCPNQDDDVGCTVGAAAGLGQTWSSPKVLKTNGHRDGDVLRPMLIIGGGYDRCEDADPDTCDATAKGRRIYVLDAADGSVLKSFVTERPVAADVFVVPDGTTGRARWAYAVDLGGNIYRISGADANSPFGDTAPGSWTITRIASLGCETAAPCDANRKFMYAPDVVKDEALGGYVLLVGSGDREKPLKEYGSAFGVKNYFFMVKDVPTSADWLSDEEVAPCGVPYLCLDSLLPILGDETPTAAQLAEKKGWYLGLHEGEQVVTSAITVYGGTTFSTHTPTDPPEGACTSDLGTARVYNVRFANAAPSKPKAKNRSEEIDGGGLPPSPVAGLVKLDDGTTVPFIIGGDGKSPLEGGEPVQPALTTLPKSITYWYIEK
jgi:type IV pilus assembly protein PilY1